MATENAVMAASITPGKTMISNAACEPHVQDLCRFLVSLGAKIDGIGSNVLHITGVEGLSGGSHSIGAGARRGRQLHRDGGRHRRRHHDRRHRSRRPLAGPAGPEPARRRGRARRRLGARAAVPDARDQGRPRRRDPEGRGRAVAGVPGRPDVDRRRGRDAGEGHRAGLREDVREPPLLRRQAGVDGRANHPLRPASRRRHRCLAALRPADVEPGHPRRHGDGDRRAVRRRARRRSATRTRSTRATSASTSACARSAPRSNASRRRRKPSVFLAFSARRAS